MNFTAHPSGTPEFIPGFLWGSGYSMFSFKCMFGGRSLSFCPSSFDHCVVCPFSVYGFSLPLWYLQALLKHNHV